MTIQILAFMIPISPHSIEAGAIEFLAAIDNWVGVLDDQRAIIGIIQPTIG